MMEQAPQESAYVEYSYETVQMTDRVKIPWTKKINPLWWLVGPDGWDAPATNNGSPYLPEVTSVWLRRFYWFICRNPLMNFVGFVIGVEDRNYSVTGSKPVLRTTGRDCDPPQKGWRWAVLWPPLSVGAIITTVVAVCIMVFFPITLYLQIMWLVVAVFAAMKIVGPLPYLSYYNGKIEAYLGWRPASGGFGLKFVLPKVS